MFIRDLKIIVLIAIVSLPGCSNEGCYEETESDIIISLYETDSDVILPVDSITIFGVGLDDQFLYQNSSNTVVNLPLFAAAASSSFVVVNGLVYDTLTINYNHTYNFVSKACGYNYIYTIESIVFTTNRIDTILIINNSVTPGDEENLRAFF